MNRRIVAVPAAAAALTVCGALARAEPAAESKYQVGATMSGGWSSSSNPPGANGTHEAMSVDLVAFRRPLEDDESPYSLQAFMQHESTLTLSAVVGRSEAADPSGEADAAEWNVGAGAAIDAYLKPWLAMFAGASYTYFKSATIDAAKGIHILSAEAGIGFRHRATRLDLSVAEGVARTGGAFGPWRGSVALSVFTVIKHRLSLDASGTLLTGGGQGFLEAELFPTKGTGVFVSAFASRFDAYQGPTGIKQYGGSGGLVYWFDARSGLLGEYTLLYETDPGAPEMANGYHALTHTLLVEAYFRYR